MISKYTPLSEHLNVLSHETKAITLTFSEIEGIIGFPLPSSARSRVEWWANSSVLAAARAWPKVGWKTSHPDVLKEQVTFFRSIRQERKESTGFEKSRKYDSLRTFFSRLPPTQKQIVLTFQEIEKILSAPLPRAAEEHPEWWSNSAGTPNSRAWIEANWRIETVFREARFAVFHRKGGDHFRRINRYVKFLLEGGNPMGHPAVETRLRWVRICRQVEWYFQGTVIYERGPTLPPEAEEDYEVCKRELFRYAAK
jgi:hypothetical protein